MPDDLPITTSLHFPVTGSLQVVYTVCMNKLSWSASALMLAISASLALPTEGWAQNAATQASIDTHETWDQALEAAASRFDLPAGIARIESWVKDKKTGESISFSKSSVTALENGYRIHSISPQEETEMYTDALLRIQSKTRIILDPEWQKRTGYTRMESRIAGTEARWTRITTKDKTESGSTAIEANSLDISLMGPALSLLVNAGRRADIETILPMGSMKEGIHFSFYETDNPWSISPSYPFPAGWEPPKGKSGVMVEMKLTGAPALVWRHRQYFFFSQRDETNGPMTLVLDWGGDPKWPSIQRRQ